MGPERGDTILIPADRHSLHRFGGPRCQVQVRRKEFFGVVSILMRHRPLVRLLEAGLTGPCESKCLPQFEHSSDTSPEVKYSY
jgi:hypothetical protein